MKRKHPAIDTMSLNETSCERIDMITPDLMSTIKIECGSLKISIGWTLFNISTGAACTLNTKVPSSRFTEGACFRTTVEPECRMWIITDHDQLVSCPLTLGLYGVNAWLYQSISSQRKFPTPSPVDSPVAMEDAQTSGTDKDPHEID